ncbi:MAG: hypothetical protein A2Y25_07230 [Candidatus Melainabacteria bacterium GWF2_37_15]|nr:MAG: hypothetical protein A2Y25_07230 [Candidatus Melainabacteria bacterium GWF2_37_15]
MKQNRVNANLPESLAYHVNIMCGEGGFYDSASEYIRDLIRQDLVRIEHEKTERLKAKLVARINRPVSEFIKVDPESAIQEFKQRCRAKRKAK